MSRFLSKIFRHPRHRAAMFGVLTAMVGVIGISIIHAASFGTAEEAENGTITGCASTVTDASASSGQAVNFGSSTCTAGVTSLDITGNTIPDTNYAIPSGAIFMDNTGNDTNAGSQVAPVKTLNKAISIVPSGGTIIVRGGTYRDWYNNGTGFSTTSKAITFQSYPHEQAWFDGADVEPTGNWTSDGSGHWYMAWNTPSFCNGQYYNFPYNAQNSNNSGPCTHSDNYGNTSARYPAAGDPQMVYIDGAQMPEVESLSLATGGKFFYDWTNKRIYISTDPSGHTVELAARPMALSIGVGGSKILGLGFRHYASNEYNNTTEAPVFAGGTGSNKIENSVFTQNAGYGLGLAPVGSQVLHSVFAANGFDGITANGHQHSTGAADGLIVSDSVLNGNNAEHYGLNCSASCAAAGMKIAHMDGFTFKDNIVENNANASGIWCDLACSGGVIINNLIHDNGQDAIMYEVSDTGIIASNLVYNNNGFGIRLVSPNTKVYNNTLVNNACGTSCGAGGMWVYDDARYFVSGANDSTCQWSDVGPNTAGDAIVNNIIYDSGNANTLMNSQSNASSTDPSCPGTQPNQFYSSFNYNAYYRGTSTPYLMRWIPYGVSQTFYGSLATWQSGQGFDANATMVTGGADPFFTNAAGDDYTVRSDSTAYQSGTTIPADVAAALGVSAAAGQNRGALAWPGQ